MTIAMLCLVMAVYHEARGEPLEGQIAVAHTVINRVESDRYPDDRCAVVQQPHQFSFYWAPPTNEAAWQTAIEVSQGVVSGTSVDPTNGAMHYTRHDTRPVWTNHMSGQRIGNHIFWREQDEVQAASNP